MSKRPLERHLAIGKPKDEKYCRQVYLSIYQAVIAPKRGSQDKAYIYTPFP